MRTICNYYSRRLHSYRCNGFLCREFQWVLTFWYSRANITIVRRGIDEAVGWKGQPVELILTTTRGRTRNED